MKETANMWEYKVGINAIITNFEMSNAIFPHTKRFLWTTILCFYALVSILWVPKKYQDFFNFTLLAQLNKLQCLVPMCVMLSMECNILPPGYL